MPLGKIGVLVLAGVVAVALGGFGAALKGWSGSEPVAAVTLADLDARKDDGADLLAAEDDDRDDADKQKAKKAKKAKKKAKRQKANTNTNSRGGAARVAPKKAGAAPAASAPKRDWSDDSRSASSVSGGGSNT